jgi:septal ring-binding cell division protein DamX
MNLMQSRAWVILTSIAMSWSVSSIGQPQTCVPKADRTWLCGSDVKSSDAAALPAPDQSSRSRPPLLLMNPQRFNDTPTAPAPEAENAANATAVAAANNSASAQTTVAEPAAEIVAEPAAEPVAEISAEPAAEAVDAMPAAVAIENSDVGNAESTDSNNTADDTSLFDIGAFTIQLARTSTASGFANLRSKLPARAETFELQERGAWVLLYGRFDSIEQARAAIPAGVTGAFARRFNNNR